MNIHSNFKSISSILLATALYSQAIGEINDAMIAAKRPPALLSEFGFFDDLETITPHEILIPYEIIAPLFTDDALKYRLIYMPEGAEPAPYQTENVLDFPIGSALIKTFAYETDAGLNKVETRVLLHQENGWKAYPYAWNDEGTDAELKLGGKDIEMTDSEGNSFNYHIPNANQCKSCHFSNDESITPIGPKIRQLNMNDQLLTLLDRGIISNLPKNKDIPTMVDYADKAADPLLRGRAYLDANCAHCHSPGKPGDTSGLYLNWEEDDPTHLGVMKKPIAAGRGSGNLKYDILPGNPEESIIYFRLNSTDPGIMMPELGRATIDEAGLEIIRAYIEHLK